MVARNRFLAESMLHGKSSKPNYSVPTCHTALKQLEQARLAREFELQRSKVNNTINNNIEEEPKDNDDPFRPKLRRTLSRTTSVGKLVSNFEHGNLAQSEEEFHNDDSTNDDEQQQQIVMLRIPRPTCQKPPLATKPILRHTVSKQWQTGYHYYGVDFANCILS